MTPQDQPAQHSDRQGGEMSESEPKHEVWEIHGGAWASDNGFDLRVCRTWKEFTDALADDTDEMQVGDEIRIVHTEYTQDQLDEVYFDE